MMSDNLDLTQEEIKRYQRQMLLPEIGLVGQKKLSRSKVLCFGAGGLGSPTLYYLAAAGIGHLGIVDGDNVEISNLHRQIIHSTSRLGIPKSESARIQLKDLNPHVDMECINKRINSTNILDIMKSYDVIIDGTDNFPSRFLINDACVMMKKPNIYGAIHRFDGQASIFAPHLGGPCYRCLFPEPPPAGIAPSCAEAGVLGVLPGIIGCIQATETVKMLLGQGNSLMGRLLCFDALKMRFRELKIRRDPNCPVCSDHPSITKLQDAQTTCAQQPSTHYSHSDIHLNELIKIYNAAPQNVTIVDVRERFEHQLHPFPGANNIPLAEIPDKIKEWRKDQTIYLLCQSGLRSKQAQLFLQSQGFSNVINVTGGLSGKTGSPFP